MLVKDRMTANPYCIRKDTSISAALDLMAERDFHRIPVVDGQELVGLVTEGTIAENTPSKATSLSVYELNYLLAKSTVESVMIKDVVTIHPDALLEEAAVLMRQHDIGCLVVTEGRKVVGIITQNDIFEAFIDLLGYYEEGSRYVIQIAEDKPGVLADLTGLFFDETAQITNLAVLSQRRTDRCRHPGPRRRAGSDEKAAERSRLSGDLGLDPLRSVRKVRIGQEFLPDPG